MTQNVVLRNYTTQFWWWNEARGISDIYDTDAG